MNHFSQCFTPFWPGLWALLSLHERHDLKRRNTSMSPFTPSLPPVIIQLIFFPPPVVPAIAAITIYLGSLFHYSRAAVKPEEKCCVLWFMEAIWPVLIRGIYECDAEFGNGLCSVWTWLSEKMEWVSRLIEKQTWSSLSSVVEYECCCHISLCLLPADFTVNVTEENTSFNSSDLFRDMLKDTSVSAASVNHTLLSQLSGII